MRQQTRQDPAVLATPRGLAGLALPLALSTGLGFFLHYANRTVLAWSGPGALAASLPAGMLAWTGQSLFILTCAYLGTFAAQHHAAGEDREAGAMAWPMFLVAGIATLIALALIPFRHLLAGAFGTEPAVESKLAELLGWYLAETGPIAACSGIAAFCGGLGRTRRVLAFGLAGAAICIGLNYWLVLGGFGVPALGITGAGIASLGTSLAMLAAWLAWFFGPQVRRQFHTWDARNLDPARLRRFCRYSVPRGCTEVLEMVSFVVFTAVVSHLGTDRLAASNLAFSTYLVVLVPVIGFSQGVAIATGTAVGAGRPELARRAVRSALLLLVPYIVLLVAAFLLFPAALLAPGRGDDPEAWHRILSHAVPVMACLALMAPADGLQWIWRFAVQGAGDTRWPLVVLVLLSVVCLAVPIWWVPALAGDQALVWCYLLLAVYVWIVAGAMAWRFYRGPWAGMNVRS